MESLAPKEWLETTTIGNSPELISSYPSFIAWPRVCGQHTWEQGDEIQTSHSPSALGMAQLLPRPAGLGGFTIHFHLLGSGGPSEGQSPAALADPVPVAVGDAGEVKAPRADGHSTTAEDAANSSRIGGSHHGVLWEGAEDGARQGHHHGRGFNDDGGALALPDTALIAAVGQR
ncbi:hypothetical protein DV515_00016797, partial [Chloebia gouldiae]